MTAQPTRDQLRALALREDAKEHQPDSHGPGRCGDPECFTTCVVDGCEWPCETAWLLDQLDRAEHRIARLEAQTSIRGRAVVMYRERARDAEARIKAVEDVLDKVEAGEPWLRPVDFSGTPFPITVDTSDIRRALDGDT